MTHCQLNLAESGELGPSAHIRDLGTQYAELEFWHEVQMILCFTVLSQASGSLWQLWLTWQPPTLQMWLHVPMHFPLQYFPLHVTAGIALSIRSESSAPGRVWRGARAAQNLQVSVRSPRPAPCRGCMDALLRCLRGGRLSPRRPPSRPPQSTRFSANARNTSPAHQARTSHAGKGALFMQRD